jgi:nicotinamide mononucleotide transporter
MAADIIYIHLYASRNLYLTSLLYVVFLAMCAVGLRDWLRDSAAQQAAAA